MKNFAKKKTKKLEEESSEESAEESSEESSIIKTLVDIVKSGGDETPESRSIMFVGTIDEEAASDLISAMLVMAQTKDEEAERAKDIKIFINTDGGSADEMFAIYDTINCCKKYCDIQTIGFGKVMSAGTLILSAGTEGKRFISEHCRVMIHSVNGGHQGEIHSIQNEMEQMVSLQNSYIKAMAKETNMSKKYIQGLIKKKINIYSNSEEAIDLGLADEIWAG